MSDPHLGEVSPAHSPAPRSAPGLKASPRPPLHLVPRDEPSASARENEGRHNEEQDGKTREDEKDTGYKPPESPDQDHPLALGFKVAVAMFIADLVARRLFGFESPTWSVLIAAFLSTSAPMDSASAAGKKVIATLIGIAMGVACAYLNVMLPGVPTFQFAVVGAIGGFLATRSPDYLFAAVVATVVAFVASGGGDPTIEVATETVCMILIGCAIGPLVVFLVERARAWMHGRGGQRSGSSRSRRGEEGAGEGMDA